MKEVRSRWLGWDGTNRWSWAVGGMWLVDSSGGVRRWLDETTALLGADEQIIREKMPNWWQAEGMG